MRAMLERRRGLPSRARPAHFVSACCVLVAAGALIACGGQATRRKAVAHRASAGPPAASGAQRGAAAVRGARDGPPASEDTRPWGDLVVRVGRARLTKAALERWTAVEAVLTYGYKPKRPVPKGVVPDPPAYAACAAYLARLSRREGEHPAPTRARLKGRCAQQHTSVQRHILDLLIVDYWVREEAAARGVEITAPELSQ